MHAMHSPESGSDRLYMSIGLRYCDHDPPLSPFAILSHSTYYFIQNYCGYLFPRSVFLLANS
jgi:hypothetical protein